MKELKEYERYIVPVLLICLLLLWFGGCEEKIYKSYAVGYVVNKFYKPYYHNTKKYYVIIMCEVPEGVYKQLYFDNTDEIPQGSATLVTFYLGHDPHENRTCEPL
jgi:hypothetical protein